MAVQVDDGKVFGHWHMGRHCEAGLVRKTISSFVFKRGARAHTRIHIYNVPVLQLLRTPWQAPWRAIQLQAVDWSSCACGRVHWMNHATAIVRSKTSRSVHGTTTCQDHYNVVCNVVTWFDNGDNLWGYAKRWLRRWTNGQKRLIAPTADEHVVNGGCRIHDDD